ncbi:MAG: amidophosphoribosyltransferase [bacterium]|nr:amidophosphoribosyltransferase [bacterium]
MSDSIKHECAVALLVLRAGGAVDGATKLSLLLEKQHNRGQDGAGVVTLAAHPEAGRPAYNELKSASATPLADLLGQIARRRRLPDERIFLGHLRYATYGKGDVGFCHPFVHKAARLSRTLFLAGNFNLTNTHDLFDAYVRMGKFPESEADGYLICEWLASAMLKVEMEGEADRGRVLVEALRRLLPKLDGAFTLCGMTGDGWSFAIRDAHGIRPGYCLVNDAVAVVASERPAIQAAFNCGTEDVKELEPGVALVVSPTGEVARVRVLPEAEARSCVFERIYFSRANDAEIHRERKALGAALARPLLAAVDYDLEHTFFSYIPNSAQVAFHGLLQALWTEGLAEGRPVRFGQIAVKDAKFRTFIADAAARREFYQHVYDVTYGLITPGADTLVVLDDSIVRGNTMKHAILPMLDRLGPKRIIVASSAPPILFPDCYGIDMSTLGELVAFRALVNLAGEGAVTRETDLRALAAKFPLADLSAEIARLVTPAGMRAKVDVVFQSVEALHKACPHTTGDWYFTGNYPTPGGERVLRRSLENYLAHREGRSY